MSTRTSASFVKRNWRTASTAILVAVDLGAVACANAVALGFHAAFPAGDPKPLPDPASSTIVYSLVFLAVAMMAGLYRSAFHVSKHRQYAILLNTYLYTCGITGLGIVLSGNEAYIHDYPLFYFSFLGVTLFAFRILADLVLWSFRRRGYGYSDAVILGHSEGMEKPIADRLGRFPELGYRLHKHLVLTGVQSQKDDQIKQFDEALTDSLLPTVFIPTLDIAGNGFLPLVEICKQRNIRVELISEEIDSILDFARVRDFGGIPINMRIRRRTQTIKSVVKRGFDILGSLFALIIFAPVIMLISLLIVLEDGRPIFFIQKRGLIRGGKQFDFLKFRSMRRNAESIQQELYKQNQLSGGLFRIDNDPRVTRVGRVIRKFSLDELPQIVNVLKGDMSLVGPRPLTIADLENLTPENKLGGFYKLRAEAKPGITGLWQISGRRDIGFKQMVLLDLYYIENHTVAFDLEILAHTIPVVLFGRGGY